MSTNKTLVRALLILLGIIVFVGIPATTNPVGKIWSTTGIFELADSYGETTDLGYVRDNIEPTITYTTPVNGYLHGVFAFFLNGIPTDGQQVSLYRLYVGIRYPNTGVYFNFVMATGTNRFSFHNLTDDTVTIIHNFDKIVIPADWHAIQVYKGNEVTTFMNGYWGYQNFSDQPITVLMDGESYTTKRGFGGVCTDYDPKTNIMNMDVCPYVYQEFDLSDHMEYFVQYPLTDEADIVIAPQ